MSCSLRSCGFGKIKNKSIFKESVESKKTKSRRRFKRSKRSRRKSKRSLRSRRRSRKSHRFGFKYLSNDKIIETVGRNYPQNLTCDRA